MNLKLQKNVLVFVLLAVICWAGRPVVVLYDKSFKELPAVQQTMVALTLRNLQLDRNFSPIIRTEIKPKRGIDAAAIHNTILLTSRPNLEKIKSSPIPNQKTGFLWRLNIPLPCSNGFRLAKPITSAAEEVERLIFESRHQEQSTVQAYTLKCTVNQWQHQTIVAGVVEMAPFALRSVKNGTVRYNGSTIELFENLASSMGFRYNIVEPKDLSFGAPGNRTYGLTGMALRGEIDAAVVANAYSSQSLFEPVWPTGFGRWLAVIPPPTVLYDLSSNFKPFQWDVWICVVSSILAVSSVMWIFTKLTTSRSDLGLDLLYNVSLVTGQGGFNPRHLHGRFLSAAWNLGAFVIVFSYTSVLISFVTARLPQPLVQNLEDFVTKGTLKPVAQRGYIFSTTFLGAQSGLNKQIGDLFRKYPETLIDNPANAINLVLGGRYGFIAGSRISENWVRSDYVKTKKCRMTLLEIKGMPLAFSGWNTSKLVPALSDELRKGILRANDGGLLRYYDLKYVPRIACFSLDMLVHSRENEPSPLNFIELQTAFLILGVGVLASILSFLWEKSKR